MTLERRAISAVKWAAMGRVGTQTLSWVATVFVMRLLHPSDYGLMALVAVVTAVATSVGEAGVNSCIIQAKNLDDGLLRKLAGLTVIMYAALFAAVAISAPLAALWFDEPRLRPLLMVAALQFLLTGASAVPQALAARELRFKLLTAVELVSVVTHALTTLALAWSGFGVWALVGGALMGTTVRSLVLLTFGRNSRPSFDLSGTSEHLGFGSRIALASILMTIILQSDSLIGGRFLDATALGIYAVAVHLATLPMQKLMGVINQVAFSTFARMQDESERVRSRLLLGQRLLATAIVPAMWGIAAVAPELIGVLLGAKWTGAVVPLQLVSIVIPLRGAAILMTTGVMGVGRADVLLRMTLITALTWPACFAVGAQWGATGLAAAWLVGIPISFSFSVPQMCRAVNARTSEIFKAIAPALTAGTTMVAAVTGARWIFQPDTSVASLAGLCIVGAVVYVVVILVLDRSLIATARQLSRAVRAD